MANPENKQIPYESTQKDIRDAIESVAMAIGGITHPDAEDIVYDNSVSGLSATDVQNALDEIVSDIPTVNNGTLTIQQNGTSKGSFTANSPSNVNVNIETPTADKKTATDQFNTANGGLLSKCVIDLAPVQDLNGYDHPWVGGAGKNSFVSATAKTEEQNGVKIWTDGDGIYHINGAPTATTTILFPLKQGFTIPSSSTHHFYLGNDFSNSNVAFLLMNGSTQVDSWTCIPVNRDSDAYSTMVNKYIDGVRVIVQSGVSVSNVSIAPMLLLDTETDTSYAPWDNICPISGHTEVDLLRCGKNLYDGLSEVGNWTKQRCTAVFNGDGSITITNTQSGSTWLGFVGTLGTTVNINNFPCSKGDSFIVTSGNDTVCSSMTVGEIDSNNILLKSTSITSGWTYTVTEDDTTAIVLRYNPILNDGATGTIYPMVRKSTETDSTFEPYLGHLYTVQIGSTIYGGTDEMVSGEMTNDKVKLVLDDLSWSYDAGDNIFYTTVISPKVKDGEGISDNFAYNSSSSTSMPTATFKARLGRIYVKDTRYTDAPTFKSNNSSAEFVLTLETPQTIQLTPQQIEALVGQNNLSTPLDGQSIDYVEYREVFAFDDVEKVVSLRVPISMLGTDESGNTTASRAYTTGEFFYKDGKMYKVLTNIASGATFTVGTNISETTLFAELTALA